MNFSRVLMVSLMVLFFLSGWIGPVRASPIDKLISAAKEEGRLELYAPSSLTPQGAQALGAAFNKRYGLDIKLVYSGAAAMFRDIAKVISSAAAGIPPAWDLMISTDAQIGNLWSRKLLEPFDYKSLGIDPKIIHFDSCTVSFGTQLNLPAYNNNILPAKDVPKSWEDLLDPKWKGKKLGMHSGLHHLAILAVGAWGEEKATNYVKGLAEQDLIIGRPAEIYQRLVIGEILVAVTMVDAILVRGQKRGSPTVFAQIEPIIAPQWHASVLKDAPHPNVAHLFTAFNTTPEAQDIWEKYNGCSSAFIPGTEAYKKAQGKKILTVTEDQVEEVDRLTKEYGKILGFIK